jgi:type II secretion system protein N
MAGHSTHNEISMRARFTYILGFIALGTITFGTGLWFMFPDASLERRLNAELAAQVPFRVRVHQLERSFPFTLKIRCVEADIPQFRVKVEELRLAPAWGSFLQLQPGLKAEGRVFDGVFRALFTSKAGELEAKGMHLSGIIPGFNSIRIEAQLEHAHLQADIADAITPRHGDIRISELRIYGLDKVGLGGARLDLGNLEFTLRTHERRLQVELRNPRGDFDISGSGSISPPRLNPSARLNLRIRIGNIPAEHAQLEELLGMAGIRKNADGYLLRLGGPLESPYLR